MNHKFLSKFALAFGLASTLAVSAFAAEKAPATQATSTEAAKKNEPKFKNDEDKLSYIIGYQFSTTIHNDQLKVNRAILVKAIEEGLSGKTSELTPEDSKAFLGQYFAKQQKIIGEKNAKDGESYLAKIKKEAGVVALPDGLLYKVITAGTGLKPKSTDTVTVDYEGKFINGQVFDSSYKRGKPASFPVNGVIKGWTEALQLMNEGSTYMLYIPSSLAYGSQPPPQIQPNSTLVFKVHLLSIAQASSTASAENTKPSAAK